MTPLTKPQLKVLLLIALAIIIFQSCRIINPMGCGVYNTGWSGAKKR